MSSYTDDYLCISQELSSDDDFFYMEFMFIIIIQTLSLLLKKVKSVFCQYYI